MNSEGNELKSNLRKAERMVNEFHPPFILKRTTLPERYRWELFYFTPENSEDPIWILETDRASRVSISTEVMRQFAEEMKELGVRNAWDQVRGD